MDDIIWPPKKPATPEATPPRPIIRTPLDAATSSEVPVAASEDVQTYHAPELVQHEQPKKRFAPLRLSKKQWIITVIIFVLLVAGAGAYFVFVRKPKPPVNTAPVVSVTKTPEPVKPTTQASKLTGLQIDPTLANRPVTGIMIENSPDARPQSGLNDAGVVYEAIAEGGITRFLALFQESKPNYIGPVRSSRPYYLDFALPFDAGYGHVGGSPEALSDIKSLGVKDLDQFYNSEAYIRISTRYAPHNVYTGFDKLDALNQKKGYTSSNFTGFPRKAESPSKTPNATAIDFNISGVVYNVHYDYDAATNSYKRSEGGKPHIDEKSGAQLTPKVVIALIMGYAHKEDGYHSDYETTGSGKMLVFQDGTEISGTWSKADRKAQFNFTDSAGAPLKLNPGQTWLTVLDSVGAATYK